MDNRILFITRSWHGHGGMQRLSRDLDRELRLLYGNSFHCIHPKKPGAISLISFSIRAVVASLRLRKSDYIHLGDASLLLLGRLLKFLSGAHLSVTACGLDVIYPKKWYQWILRKNISALDRIACISSNTSKEMKNRGADDAKISIIPCGISSVAKNDMNDPRLVVSIGRLIERKGFAWFLEYVFPRVLQSMSDVKYIIIGSGPEEARIRSIIKQLNLEENVELKTQCEDGEKENILSKASAFIMPNIHVPGDMEGFGIVAIEASARGVPVLAADIEGLKDSVIDGSTGRLYKAKNPIACEEAFLAMMKNPLDSDSVAKVTQKHFDWSSLIKRYRDELFSTK